MRIYAIKDDKSQTWQGSYAFVNDAIAIREFDSAFKQGKLGLMNQYPEDFSLYCLGSYEDSTGKVTGDLQLVKNFADFAQEAKTNG